MNLSDNLYRPIFQAVLALLSLALVSPKQVSSEILFYSDRGSTEGIWSMEDNWNNQEQIADVYVSSINFLNLLPDESNWAYICSSNNYAMVLVVKFQPCSYNNLKKSLFSGNSPMKNGYL